MIEYEEKSLLGGWCITVKSSGGTLGNIRRHGDGVALLYFKGEHNQLNCSLQSDSLSGLKKKIEASSAMPDFCRHSDLTREHWTCQPKHLPPA
jgi:hypothetical protein